MPAAASSAPTLLPPLSRAARERGLGGEGSPAPPLLGAGGGTAEDKKLREATQEWEAFFVGYLLKQMRKTAGEGGGLFAPSEGEKMFRDMLDDETARALGKTGRMGLADLLYNELAPASAREKKL